MRYDTYTQMIINPGVTQSADSHLTISQMSFRHACVIKVKLMQFNSN